MAEATFRNDDRATAQTALMMRQEESLARQLERDVRLLIEDQREGTTRRKALRILGMADRRAL